MENDAIWSELKTNRAFRRKLCWQSFDWFFHFMLHEHVCYTTAPFQHEMIRIAEDDSVKLGVFTAFRGSAKSTIFTLGLPLWGIFGNFQYKYIVIICQTQARAQQTLANIRKELETNELLIDDIGPFIDGSNTWNNNAIELPRFKAKIAVFSINEMIRGIRYGQFRPQLFINDDLEDVQSAKTLEARDDLWQRITGEILPAGDIYTRSFFVGNLVHEDSAMMRLKQLIQSKQIDGVYREYPIMTEDGQILWPGKFPSISAIEQLKRSMGSEIEFLREFMLKIVPTVDQVIPAEWIHTYAMNELPPDSELEYILVSIDPAISTSDAACKTGIVILRIYFHDDKLRIYVDPYVVNRRMNMDDAITELKNIQRMFKQYTVNFIVEGVGMQSSYAETLQREGIPAEAVKINGQDKHARLMNVSMLIKNNVFFADHGNKELIDQVIRFDASKYLDLVDALTLGLMKIASDDCDTEPQIYIAEMPNIGRRGLSD